MLTVPLQPVWIRPEAEFLLMTLSDMMILTPKQWLLAAADSVSLSHILNDKMFVRNTNLFFWILCHRAESLCSSGPQGFRPLTKHTLLLLCRYCRPTTMLLTYRSWGVQLMSEMAEFSFRQLFFRYCKWMWSKVVTDLLYIHIYKLKTPYNDTHASPLWFTWKKNVPTYLVPKTFSL